MTFTVFRVSPILDRYVCWVVGLWNASAAMVRFASYSCCQVVVLRSSQIGSNERLNEVTAEGAGTPIGATSINRSLEIERLTLLRDFKRPGGTRVYGK